MHPTSLALSILVAAFQLHLVAAVPNPHPTPAPTKTLPQKRGLSSWASSVASGLPTDIAGGVLPAFQGLPSPDDIKKQLNLTDEDINALPLEVLNIPYVLLSAAKCV